MLKACRADICRLLSPTAFDDIPSVASSLLQPLPGYQQQPNEALAGSVAPSDIGGESVLSGLPELFPSKILSTLPEQFSARPLYVNSPSNFFGNLSSSVSELPSTDQGAQYFHRRRKVMTKWKIIWPCLCRGRFYLIIFSQKENKTRI